MEKKSKTAKEAQPSHQEFEEGLTYEKALEQLEEMLDKMNGSVSLEESVTLYERADKLLNYCSGKLGEAESKIEALVKNRTGEFAMGADGRPQIEPSFDRANDSSTRAPMKSMEEKETLPF